MNDHVITKRQNPVMQGVVQLMGQARRVLMSEKVSARDRANQQAATAEQHRRLFRMTRIPRQKTHVLRGVTWSSQNRDADVSDCQDIAVAYGLMIELQTGVCTCNDPGPGPCRKLATATHEVVVDVRLADMRDTDAFAARHLLILIDVAKRIDEGGDSVSFRNQEVGAVNQALVDELPDSHPSL